MTHLVYNIAQDNFRWYADGTESGSTAHQLEDVNHTITMGTGDQIIQLRILMQESGGALGGGSTFQLQMSVNSAAYVNVTGATTDIQAGPSANLTDDAATTNRLAGGTGTFTAGRLDEADGNTTTAVDTAASGYTEILYSLKVIDADVSDADTFDFRALDTRDSTVTYNITPRLTISKPVNVNVNTNVEALTLTENQATVTNVIEILAATEALTLTENTAALVYDVDVTAGPEALTLTENQATIIYDVDVLANVEALTLTENTSDIGFGANVLGNVEALTLTENVATITLDVNVGASVEALTLTENTADIALAGGTDVLAVTEALTLTENQANVVYLPIAATDTISHGGSITRRRRPGERFVTEADLIRAHEELTKLKAKPKRQQKKVAKKAVEAVLASTDAATLEAREYLADYKGALNILDNLEIVLVTYFVLRLRKRQEDDAAAMLMLGVL